MAELEIVERRVYHLKANWKLIILNYNECLHCPVLHPALNRLTDYLGAARFVNETAEAIKEYGIATGLA